MPLINYTGILTVFTPLRQFQRFRGKINIKRPRLPHFERAKFLAITKPYYAPKKSILPAIELCNLVDTRSKTEEVNKYQEIIASEIRQHFFDSKLIGFYHQNSILAEDLGSAKILCRKQGMHFSVFGKKTLRMAIENTKFEPILEHYVSHNIIVFSNNDNIKDLLKIQRKFSNLILLFGIYHGRLLNKDDLVLYGKIPNLQTAQSGVVQILQSVGSTITSQLNCHQTNLVYNLEERMKQLTMKT